MLSFHYLTLLTLFLISCSIRSLRSCSCVASRWLFRYLNRRQISPINQFPSFLFFRTVPLKCKSGRYASKFRKSQIRNFADLHNLLDLQTFRKCGFGIADPIFFVICGLLTSASPQMHTFSPYKSLVYTVRYGNALIQSTK